MWSDPGLSVEANQLTQPKTEMGRLMDAMSAFLQSWPSVRQCAECGNDYRPKDDEDALCEPCATDSQLAQDDHARHYGYDTNG